MDPLRALRRLTIRDRVLDSPGAAETDAAGQEREAPLGDVTAMPSAGSSRWTCAAAIFVLTTATAVLVACGLIGSSDVWIPLFRLGPGEWAGATA
jgi:hypothetical protein